MGEHERALREFVRALVEWARISVDSGRFSKDEASDMRMYKVELEGVTKLILDQPADRDQAANRLHRLMGAVLYLGTHVMTSKSAAKFLKNEHTAPSRSKLAEKRKPDLELLRQQIAEAKQKIPSGRGSATAVDNEVVYQMKKKYKRIVSSKTVGCHRRKMSPV